MMFASGVCSAHLTRARAHLAPAKRLCVGGQIRLELPQRVAAVPTSLNKELRGHQVVGKRLPNRKSQENAAK